jgi:hypothetical protein
VLFTVTLAGAGYYFFVYVPRHKKPGEPVFVLPNYILTFSPIRPENAPGYVLPEKLEVWNTPAIIRSVISTLKSGDQVFVLGRFRQWARVRLRDGRIGWVDQSGLLDAATDSADERLLREISDLPLEASGHVSGAANVHIQPSRDAPIVAQLASGQPLEIYGRRLMQQHASEQHAGDDSTPRKSGRDAWYLVRVGSRAGWILGRLIDLDVPGPIASYARESNVVAWLVLDTVEDEGRQVPQYLLADRTGSPEFDFTHIRVLTWWKRKQTYAVAYVEGGLQGYFPILVTHEGSTPYFRLRLVDEQGTKFQRVYRLSDTITRVVGNVPGWESEAMPEPRSVPARRARRRHAGIGGRGSDANQARRAAV